ncbi:MAG: P-II family nitrogen regulator [Nitrospirota bacterium]
MKKVESIVRLEKVKDIMSALEKLGYPGIMLTRIEGHGKQKGYMQQFRGREYKIELIPKMKMEIVVTNEDVERVIDAIVRHARTGEIGDGKVFVYPCEGAVRIRTNERGETAI